MKVLLAQNMFYLPSRGGANRSNRLMLERLAARGHECHAVVPLTGRVSHILPGDMRGYLSACGAEVIDDDERVLRYVRRGVMVHAVRRGHELPRTLRTALDEHDPDWALVANDDPGMMVLSAALRSARRVLYLVHTLQPLPFGPRSFHPNPASTAMIERTTGLLSVSRATQDYVRQWSGLESELIYPDVYGSTECRSNPGGRTSVTLVNACGYKGNDIFLQLADAMPDVPFLAVEGWGTTDRDRAALAARPNIEVWPGTDDMETVYDRSRVLLMPSLWDEAFGYCSVEALIRGIPVLAADLAGLRESTLGVGRLLPVAPIRHYPRDRAQVLPNGDVPAQDVRPWLEALGGLLADPREYDRVADSGRRAATAFVAGLDPDALEKLLVRLTAGRRARPTRKEETR
jgi:glycosyltransferase involved in cell wall biosynthesis